MRLSSFIALIAVGCGGLVEPAEPAANDRCGLAPCDDHADATSPASEGPFVDAGGDSLRPDAGVTPDSSVDGGVCSSGAGARFATSVIDHHFGTGQSFNQAAFPEPILGPPFANRPDSVVSLGNGGWVVLAFDGNAIVDGPGTDFTVFENPLAQFKELATVAVSEDGVTWHEFPCTSSNSGPDFGSCAGVGIVRSSPENGIDPLDPTVSGGDHYDLADLGVTRARYVRITDRADLDGANGVFDLDAVAIVNAECP